MMEKMKITLRTKSPVVLSGPGNSALLTVTRDTFGGTVLRGLVAARYIEKKGLGRGAHEDADFRRLFFGGLRFVDAYPEKNASASIPLPASLQKSKVGDELRDLFDDDPEKGFKACRGLGVITEAHGIIRTSVKKSMTLHMSRSGELPGEKTGNADNEERISGKSREGHIFNYESIDEGQCFTGLLIGERKELEALKAAIGESWTGRAGRSKYVEYGEIECTLDEIEPLASAVAPGGNVMRLRLQTPLLPLGGNATSAEDVLKEAVADEMNRRRGTTAFGVGKIFANAEPVDNFVGVWRLRRPRQTALSAGSCFALEKDGAWDAEDIEALRGMMHEGVGLRTEEGFGQLRFWPQAHWTLAGEQDGNGPSATRKITDDRVKDMAEAIVKAKRLEQIRVIASNDVKASAASLSRHPAHVFTRLDGLLPPKEAGKTAEGFAKRLQEALKDKETAFSKHLKEIKLSLSDKSKESLHDILTTSPTRPCKLAIEQMDKKDEKMAALYHDIDRSERLTEADDDVFREYWHWFFRHARKETT